MTGNFWDTRYSADGFAYGANANRFLTEHVGALPAGGHILLPAEGEGRNAVFLARNGFSVTCFDQSAVGINKARRLAAAAGVKITAVVADAMDFDYGEGRYDGAVLIFAHMPPDVRVHAHKSVVRALKPGGVILLEAFRTEQLGRSSGGPKEPEMLFTGAMLRADFSGCSQRDISVTESDLDEGAAHQGRGAVIRMIARR